MTLTEKDLNTLAKIAWEGGPAEAASYGITPDDFESTELQEAWKKALDAHKAFEKSAALFNELIEENELEA